MTLEPPELGLLPRCPHPHLVSPLLPPSRPCTGQMLAYEGEGSHSLPIFRSQGSPPLVHHRLPSLPTDTEGGDVSFPGNTAGWELLVPPPHPTHPASCPLAGGGVLGAPKKSGAVPASSRAFLCFHEWTREESSRCHGRAHGGGAAGERWSPITRWEECRRLWPGHCGRAPRAGASLRQQQQHKPSLRGAGLMSQMKPGAEGDPDPERGSGGASRSHFSVRTQACLCLPPSPTDPAPLGVTSTQPRATCFPGDVLPGPWLLCSMRQNTEPKRWALPLPGSYVGKLTFIKPAPQPTALSCRLAADVLPSREQGLALHAGLSSAVLQPLGSGACARGAQGLPPRRASTWGLPSGESHQDHR